MDNLNYMTLFGRNILQDSVNSFFKHDMFGCRFVYEDPRYPESPLGRISVVSDVVKNKQRGIFARIAKANEGSREMLELEKQRDELNESIALIRAPIVSDIDAGKSIEEIDLANKWLESISKNGVRANDLIKLKKYRAFFDEDTIARLDKMFSLLQTSFEVGDVLRQDDTFVPNNILSQAERKFNKRDSEVKLEKIRAEKLKEIENKANAEIDKLKADYDSGEISTQDYFDARTLELRKIDDFKKTISSDEFIPSDELAKLLKETDGMSDQEREVFIDSEVYKIQNKELNSRFQEKSKKYLQDTEIGKIMSALAEVRDYRGLSMQKYIFERVADIRKIYDDQGWPPDDIDLLVNGKGSKKGLKDKTDYLKEPDSIKALLKQLKLLEQRARAIIENEEKMVSPEYRKKLDYLDQEFAHFSINPEKAAAIASLIPNPDKSSVIYLRQAEGIANLENYNQFLEDLRSSMMSSNQKERAHAADLLDSTHKILRRAEANKATRVIKGLNVAETMEEMMDCVRRNAGEHIEMVKTTKEFKAKYGDYTSGGMVFYRRGEEWKVIIDEERANNPETDPLKFKEQMVHEMHHVEFDYDEDKMNEEVGRFILNKKWTEVKSAFVAKANSNTIAKMPPTFKGKAKSKYTVEDWGDSDVVSELHAMQETINNHVVTQVGERTPMDDLVSTLTDADLLPAVSIAGFEGGDEKRVVRGAEMGDEPGIEPDTEQDKSYQTIDETVSSSDEVTNKFTAKSIIDRIEAMRKTGYVDNIPDAAAILKIVEDKCKTDPSADYLESADSAIEEVEGAVKQYAQRHPRGSGNPLRDVWNNTTFCAIEDFVQLGKNVYEFYSRRHKRRIEDHAARLGEAIFSNIPFFGKELAMDATANKEKAEDEYVNEWKGRLEHKDAWELNELIDKMADSNFPDKDQLKAILRILAEKGRIDWRRPSLWKVLNKLQSNEQFMENDQFLMQNPDALNQTLMSAMGALWDFDEFQSLLNKNEGSYDSKKNEYIATYDKMSGQLDARLADILSQYRQGKEADPAEYEAILEYAIQKGKSHQENVFFHLICGMASGLLSADRGIHLDKHLNLYPPLDWFTEMTPPPTQQWFENLCNTYFEDEYKNGVKPKGGDSQFQNFYWTVVLNNKDVIQRVEKSAAPDAWDHDWSRGIAAVGGPDTVNRFLAGRSSQKALRPTAAANQAAGLIQWFDENAKNPGAHWDNHVGNQIAGIAMFDGIMENVAYSDNITYTRKEAIVGGKPAREGGIGHHGSKNAEWHWRKMQQILDTIDPVLFGMLRNKQQRDEGSENDNDGKRGVAHATRIKNYLSATYGGNTDFDNAVRDITAMNDVFTGFAIIINEVVKQRSGKLEAVRDLLVDRRTGKVRESG